MLIRHCPWRSIRLHQLCHLRQIHTREAIHDKRWPGWQVIIGIEVHAQIKSRRKLFSESFTSRPGEIPNTTVSAFDAAFPGTLPTLNPKCVELAVRTALALNSEVPSRSAFDRKHYFYSDLPAGYQITQRYSPLAKGGYLKLSKGDVAVGITQIQLEQDTAKSTFDGIRRISLIDLNRAGSGLMEIVSEPDMRSPEEAADYVRTLQAVLRCVGSSDGNMEQGSFRCDVNVSVNKHGEPRGTRCEIKNLNSVKFMMMAITSEVFRHIELLEGGRSVPQDTRGFDENKAETFKLRSKEDAPDYRYMPDPNIPPLLISEEYIEAIRQTMPDLPDATRARLLNLGLSERDTDVLMTVDSGHEVGFDGELGKGAVAYFDSLAQQRDPRVVVNWMTHELLGQLTARKETFSDNPVSVEQLGELIDLVQDGKITGTSGKSLLKHIIANRSSLTPSVLVQELSLEAVSEDDNATIRAWCAEAIEKLPEEAEAVRQGNPRVLNKLVGKVMQLSRGCADAQNARVVLEDILRR
ncbi:GatB/GatE catalytic domain-containing protein [Suillus paluster]|uniref:GatB/GatE catalytic domain-containing protein n=1 Tax=Suillus paluster TaxID=48578 RepID=UPI001B8695AA|nr:GatB/GatE catalytic domain-containing protein [Suillus paluster]KAG1735696.1 GatB/GatE catalytic domain-containing protein [Suillus paluster]